MSKTEKNFIRKNQLITTYGVGSLLPLQSGESVIILGLDSWFEGKDNLSEFDNIKYIDDKRFAHRLSVNFLIEPPVVKKGYTKYSNSNTIIPTSKFPRLYYCPFCKHMKKIANAEVEDVYCDNEDCNGKNGTKLAKMKQDRFLVFSKDFDYIDDFPVFEWVHQNKGCKANGSIKDIKRIVKSEKLGFDGIGYYCTKCNSYRTLEKAFSEKALNNYVSFNKKIWLTNRKKSIADICDVSVGLKGGTNIWRPLIFSSLQIEVNNNTQKNIERFVNDNWECLKPLLEMYTSESDVSDPIKQSICGLGKTMGNILDEGALLNCCFKKAFYNDDETVENDKITEDSYRFEEYNVINSKFEVGNINSRLHVIPKNLEEYDNDFSRYFDTINLLPQLTVTQANAGFTRCTEIDDIDRAKNNMSNKRVSWLPAIENHGEGVFLNFQKELLEEWCKNPKVVERIKILSKSRKIASLNTTKKVEEFDISPIFVLLHTLSHLLINELSFQCGYGSSSLKERIYCKINEDFNDTNKMYGILIYVASGDLDGSLGGLVRMGQPKYLEDIFYAAIEKARWCSSDPICIESKGQGPDSCNLAACCNCTLLPETCCDGYWNKYLDRAMLIGTLDNPQIGFFNKK